MVNNDEKEKNQTSSSEEKDSKEQNPVSVDSLGFQYEELD